MHDGLRVRYCIEHQGPQYSDNDLSLLNCCVGAITPKIRPPSVWVPSGTIWITVATDKASRYSMFMHLLRKNNSTVSRSLPEGMAPFKLPGHGFSSPCPLFRSPSTVLHPCRTYHSPAHSPMQLQEDTERSTPTTKSKLPPFVPTRILTPMRRHMSPSSHTISPSQLPSNCYAGDGRAITRCETRASTGHRNRPSTGQKTRPATGLGQRLRFSAGQAFIAGHEETMPTIFADPREESRSSTGFETRPMTGLETRSTTGLWECYIIIVV